MPSVEQILDRDALSDEEAVSLIAPVGFTEPEAALNRIRSLCDGASNCSEPLRTCLPMLLSTLSTTAQPDSSLINFHRYLQSVADRGALLAWLVDNPRAVEILIRLFVGSQYLTEILLRNPTYLNKLVAHKRLAEIKSRPQFVEEGKAAAEGLTDLKQRFDAYRRFQQWELLRIGACDSFGLMDLKSVTVQLSLLADSLTQNCLEDVAGIEGLDIDNFVVLAMGKLGGEEINYSSDIDLIFLTRTNATAWWKVGQKLIKGLMDVTSEGFLYRVDMRLRPWGQSGALVNTVESHLAYLKKNGMLWELQALLKARPIAGNPEIAREFLAGAEPLMFSQPVDDLRENVRKMKSQIEEKLVKEGKAWGEVKGGPGSIRDIEFVVQFLQLRYGGEYKSIHAIGTLDGLTKLASRNLLPADEYRELSTGYGFLRTVEHALQLMHHKQVHVMPDDPGELAFLARRLDYPSADEFLKQYEACRRTIRRIYEKYIEQSSEEADTPVHLTPEQVFANMPDYQNAFTEERIRVHERLMQEIEGDQIVSVDAVFMDERDIWEVTIVGEDHSGVLSLITGLLFVGNCNILDGNVFTGGAARQLPESSGQGRITSRGHALFVDVFTVRAKSAQASSGFWTDYESQLNALLLKVRDGQQREATQELAKLVGSQLQVTNLASPVLYPVEIEFDQDATPDATRMTIQTVDTIGFLYEFCNALSLSGIDIQRVIVGTDADRVVDILDVTERDGSRVDDPDRIRELRATVVLIKQFTHLLPNSPNPGTALLHFREFLEAAIKRPVWYEDLARLDQSEVLDGLARLLGVSDFLWEDFLKVQHDNLFPLVTNPDLASEVPSRAELAATLRSELQGITDEDQQKRVLNEFKDREMFRIDMWHIIGQPNVDRRDSFGEFSEHLTDLAEVVLSAALELVHDRLVARHGVPITNDGTMCGYTLVALGKCGGREMGFASDIELMLIYDADGSTDGDKPISTAEFFPKMIDQLNAIITAEREGIFQIDLRLRPYGTAGAKAVTTKTFEEYFSETGPAWPYERQALVKLRPVAGNVEFGNEVVRLRDQLIYSRMTFDVQAMVAIREKQVRQLVEGGTLNAKLSPGGLVDVEYLVQAMQIRHGQNHPSLRSTNTREGIAALKALGFLSGSDADELLDAYIFLRRLIDALRVVRGHAKDLTVPEPETEGFLFLARRLEYRSAEELQADLEEQIESVRRINEQIIQRL